jgi:pectate lyase
MVGIYTMKIQWNDPLHLNNQLLIDIFLNDKKVNIKNVCTYTTMSWIYYENLWKGFNESKVSKSIFKRL